MEPRISLLTLAVDDLERSLAFYRDGLGFPSEGIVGREFEHGAVAFFDLHGGLKLALWPRASLAHDAGIAVAAKERHGVRARAQCRLEGRGRPGDGARAVGGRDDREAGGPDLLGRIRRIFPGSRQASVGGGVESAVGGGEALIGAPSTPRRPT